MHAAHPDRRHAGDALRRSLHRHSAFEGFSLSLDATDDAEAKRLFGALTDGGQVQMPLTKTFFAIELRHARRSLRRAWMVIVPAM